MKPENILKSDYLDILFENKNKAYGAYDLRKTYPQRLLKSMSILLGCLLIFVSFQSWKTPKKRSKVDVEKIIDVTLGSINPDKEEPKKELPKLKKEKATAPMAEVIYTKPLIVKHIDETIFPPIESVDTSAISNKFNPNAPASTGLVGVDPGPTIQKGGFGSKDTGASVTSQIIESEDPIYNPSEMPQYPGGVEALKQFMLKHLRQPDDLEEGTQVVVNVKFVVNKMGSIEQIEIQHSGREDLGDEVERVVKKMPNWKPGSQGGKPVNVYFRLPITFRADN